MSEAETAVRNEIEQFRQRQISRMVILGAIAENKPLLEGSYLRVGDHSDLIKVGQ